MGRDAGTTGGPGDGGTAPGAAAYPKRPRFFALKFTRLMGKVCLGAEIGPEACWLLAFIVSTEDAAGYRRPVGFFNEDLATRCGFSISAMRRARDRAVAKGWLAYIPGAKRKWPLYFVTIPPDAEGIDDGPGDEEDDELNLTAGGDIPRQSDAESGEQAAGKRRESGDEAAVNRPPTGGEADTLLPLPSSLSLSLTVSDAADAARSRPAGAAGEAPPAPAPDPEAFDPLRADERDRKEFLARWNAAGLKPLARLTATLQGRLAAHLLDPWWRGHYPAAVARAGEIAFLRDGAGRQAGRLDPSEFLRDDDFVRQVLDGKFDPHAPAARPPPGGAGLTRRQAEVAAVIDKAMRAAEGEGCQATT